ncbi:MAG TPA: methyltransferase domain-containing protein [Kofleriaceae bacterium]|nr:methyltransferase domain-containing protein [Kofleriaceae bacterium]
MLKPFEIVRILAEPALPHLYAQARSDLKTLVRPGSRVLDVGGRRSPYTVGLPARITIYDRPRESAIQHKLGLGLDDDVLATVRRRRSNVDDIVFGDMTRCELPSESFDGVISVEVIEHVREDDAFVSHIARVIRRDGWAYFTTPNGDAIENTNPDHVRHYRRAELAALLARHFADVTVTYGVATTDNWQRGLRSFDLRHPVTLARTILGNLRNHRESRDVAEHMAGTAHLFAIARRPLGHA